MRCWRKLTVVAHFRATEKMLRGTRAKKSVDGSARFICHQRIIIDAPQTNLVARRRELFEKNRLTIA